jgi:hypothetical protein
VPKEEKKLDLSVFKRPPAIKCSLCMAMEKLDADTQALVREALDSPEIRGVMIATRLKEWTGITVARDAVFRHRNGTCASA